MGTDVHFSIWVDEAEYDLNKTVPVWREVNWQQRLYKHQVERGDKQAPGIPVAPEGLRWRNYDLFAILADVRNGHGFAGCETGKGWLPISCANDRPWPDWFDKDDVFKDPMYPDEGPRDMGYHDFTYVTLEELKAYDWDGNSSELCGVISEEDYLARRAAGETGPPEGYSGGVGGKGIETYEADEYDRKKRGKKKLAPKPYVRVRWKESARSATGDWAGEIIPWLEKLAEGRPLMLIMGFDS